MKTGKPEGSFWATSVPGPQLPRAVSLGEEKTFGELHGIGVGLVLCGADSGPMGQSCI